MSVPPPALAPTTRRMGRVGQSWALAEPMLAPRIALAAAQPGPPPPPPARKCSPPPPVPCSASSEPPAGIQSVDPSEIACPKNSAHDDDEQCGFAALASRVSLIDGASAQMAIAETGYER